MSLRPLGRPLAAMAVAVSLACAGCTGKATTVDRNVSLGSAGQPSALFVRAAVDGKLLATARLSLEPDGGSERAVVADRLAQAVVLHLQQNGVPAVRLQTDGTATKPLLLDLNVVALDGGSTWKRTVVGFGLGRSRLGTVATLRAGTKGQPLLEFQIDADSGGQPGAAIAAPGLALGPPILALAQGGLSAWMLSGDGTTRDTQKTMEVIVARLDRYFRAAGWLAWTTAPKSILGGTFAALPSPVPMSTNHASAP